MISLMTSACHSCLALTITDDLGLPRARPSPQRVLPALRAFGPDLLLLSSGFDGGLGDIGNSKLDDKEKYHQGLDLSAADFEWATEQLVSVAAICCPGKVVSVLEGGYGNSRRSPASIPGNGGLP